MRILQEPGLQKKSILLIDKIPKRSNDRTWCFWEKKPGFFESLVFKRWNVLSFFSDTLQREMNIQPYQYKMIRGIELYDHCFTEVTKHPNVHIEFGDISAFGNEGSKAFAIVNNNKVYSSYIFNSILLQPIKPQPKKYFLLQHFKGWIIKTNKSCFDPAKATLMDFRVSQQLGTAFVYVMPFSEHEALIEFTMFSESILNNEAYKDGLKQYISSILKIDDYEILHEEFGVIPMTNNYFSSAEGNIINIGSAAGKIKPSSGYAFQFIQKHTDQIVNKLKNNEYPVVNTSSKKFSYYDSVLLNILHSKTQQGTEIFSNIFRNNKPGTIFRFLDNESSMADDLQIILPLTSLAFIKAGVVEALN